MDFYKCRNPCNDHHHQETILIALEAPLAPHTSQTLTITTIPPPTPPSTSPPTCGNHRSSISINFLFLKFHIYGVNSFALLHLS